MVARRDGAHGPHLGQRRRHQRVRRVLEDLRVGLRQKRLATFGVHEHAEIGRDGQRVGLRRRVFE